MYKNLKENQVEILLFIKRHIQTYGFPPTVREISESTNIKSTSTVHMELKILESLGYLKRRGSKSRGLELNLDMEDEALKDKKTLSVPILKQIQTGALLTSISNIKATYPLSLEDVKDKKLFAYGLDRDFLDQGFKKGDLLFFELANGAKSGQIILYLDNFEYNLVNYRDGLENEYELLGILKFALKRY